MYYFLACSLLLKRLVHQRNVWGHTKEILGIGNEEFSTTFYAGQGDLSSAPTACWPLNTGNDYADNIVKSRCVLYSFVPESDFYVF
jgi:hypothetical protein